MPLLSEENFKLPLGRTIENKPQRMKKRRWPLDKKDGKSRQRLDRKKISKFRQPQKRRKPETKNELTSQTNRIIQEKS